MVARRAHNPEAVGSSPTSATKSPSQCGGFLFKCGYYYGEPEAYSFDFKFEAIYLNNKILKTVYSALFAALVFAGTQFIRIPLPFGYFNLGDCFILLSAFIIGGPYAIVASALGAVLADILSGYAIYSPATLIIKTLMVIAVMRLCNNKKHKAKTQLLIIGATVAELIMVCGYFIYDVIIYGFAGAVASVFGNSMQGVFAVIASVIVIKVLEHSGIMRRIRVQ